MHFKVFTRILVYLTVIGVASFYFYQTDIGVAVKEVATKRTRATYNTMTSRIFRLSEPAVPETYYVNTLNQCYKVEFIIPSDAQFPSIQARHKISNAVQTECRFDADHGKLVVYTENGPEAEIADLR